MAQRVVHATTGGHCITCKGAINPGDRITFVNRPYPKSRVHWSCYCDRHPEADREAQPAAPYTPDAAPEAPAPSQDWNTPADAPETPPAPPARPALPPPAGAIEAAIDERIAAHVAAGGSVDLATLRSEVARAVASTGAREVVINVNRDDGSSKKLPESTHYLMPRLLRLIDAGLHVALYGPAGTGKSTALIQACEALGFAHELETLDPSTPRSTVFGYRTPGGEKVETAYSRCYTRGMAYILDEADLAPGPVQTLFNTSLANGAGGFAWGMEARDSKFRFLAAMNTPGLGPTPAYPDRRPMSSAFRDRLYLMYWPEDDNIIRRACGLPLRKAPDAGEETCSAGLWGEWYIKVRDYCEKNAPTLRPSPRVVHTGLKALAAGETPEMVADGLLFRGADETLRAKVLTACPLPRS